MSMMVKPGRWLRKCLPFPYCFGRKFVEYYHFLEESQWYSPEQLVQWQQNQLQLVLNHAYNNVKYYRRIFEERGLKPNDIRTAEDLNLLPILTKSDIRNHFEELRASNWQDFKPLLLHTSGSTGEPLGYYIDRDLHTFVNAVVWRHWRWCGIEKSDLIAVFRGTLIDDFGQPRKGHYKISGNQIHFSTFEMNNETMGSYVQVLNSKKPSMIRGYPASLDILAEFIKGHNLKVHQPVAIHTSSEVLLPDQRQLIQEVFQAPLFDFYGHGERVLSAAECDCHMGLHLSAEQGCVNFVKTSETEQMESIYNVIGTSLWNFSMPFIRYDTEDLVEVDESHCQCGRSLPLLKRLLGRQADILEGVNGVKVSPSSAVHFWKYKVAENLAGIKYAQLVQQAKEHIVVKLVGKKDKDNENIITENLRLLFGNIKTSYEYLDNIPVGQKWRFTVRRN
jgi:phenylacetate-CoA ligase